MVVGAVLYILVGVALLALLRPFVKARMSPLVMCYVAIASGILTVAVGYFGQTRGFVVFGGIVVVMGLLATLAGLRRLWKTGTTT